MEVEHISEILPAVMQGIRQRCDEYRKTQGLPSLDEEASMRRRENHRAGVVNAVKNFHLSRKPKQIRRRRLPPNRETRIQRQ